MWPPTQEPQGGVCRGDMRFTAQVPWLGGQVPSAQGAP